MPSGVVLQYRRSAGVEQDQCAIDRGDRGFEPVRDAPVELERRAGGVFEDATDGGFGVLEDHGGAHLCPLPVVSGAIIF